MRNIKDLTEALLNAATQAANGKANVEQCTVLCQCTDTIVRLARLEMDARFNNVPLSLHAQLAEANETLVLLEEKPAEAKSAAVSQPPNSHMNNFEREISRAQAELTKPGTSATRKAELEQKIKQWQERLKFLKAQEQG